MSSEPCPYIHISYNSKYIIVINHIYIIYIYWDHKPIIKWCRFSAIKRFCSFPNRDFSGRPGGVFHVQDTIFRWSAGSWHPTSGEPTTTITARRSAHSPPTIEATKQPTNHEKHHNMPRFWNPILYITCSQVHQNKKKTQTQNIHTLHYPKRKNIHNLFLFIGMALGTALPSALWWAIFSMKNLTGKNGYDIRLDGSEIRLTSWYGKYPIIYRVLNIPGGCLGFRPSTGMTLPIQNPPGNSLRAKIPAKFKAVALTQVIPRRLAACIELNKKHTPWR